MGEIEADSPAYQVSLEVEKWRIVGSDLVQRVLPKTGVNLLARLLPPAANVPRRRDPT